MRQYFHITLLAAALAWLAPRGMAQAIVQVEENGRKVYINGVAAQAERSGRKQPVKRYRLVYWSATENRWKPVPTIPALRAARSAAAEVNQQIAALGAPAAVSSGSPASSVSSESSADSAATATSVPAISHKPTSAELDSVIEAAAARHGVDPNLVRAVIRVESGFNPRAVSNKGAMGLMQLMPATARGLSVTNAFDPKQNVDAGVRHLKSLLDAFSGDVPLSLAAYNAGAQAVTRNGGVPPYRETRQYVKRITQLYGGGTALIGGSSPIHVYRGPNGVLTITNTD